MSQLPQTLQDIDFAIGAADVYPGPAAAAQARACLFPLTGRLPLPEAHAALRQQWRARVEALRAAGWRPLADPTLGRAGGFARGFMAARKLRNCPPFGVRFKRAAPACHYLRACPYCHAREVAAAYRGLRAVAGFAARPLALLTRLRRMRFAPGRAAADVVDEVVSLQGADLAELEGAGLPPVAARVFATLAPDEQQPAQLVCLRGVMALVPAALVPGPDGDDGGLPAGSTFRRWATSPEMVSRAVAAAMPYPAGMMRADAAAAVAALHALAARRAKLSAATGLMACAPRLIEAARLERRAAAAPSPAGGGDPPPDESAGEV